MPTQFSWAVDAPIVGLYLLATMFAGLAVRKYVGSVETFLVAGREMKVYLGIASLAATEFGIITCVYTAQAGYSFGFSGVTPGILQGLAMFLIGITGFCVKPLRDSGAITVPELLERQFGPRIRWLAGVVIVLGGLLNMGVFLRIGGEFLTLAAGLDPGNLVTVMTVLLIGVAAYTILGGMLSVLITDFLQFIVMSAGLLAVTFLILSSSDLGWGKLVSTVETRIGAGGFNPFLHEKLGADYVMFFVCLQIAATLTWQTTIARVLAAKDTKTGQQIYTRTSFFFVCRFMIPVIWGIAALAILTESDILTLPESMRMDAEGRIDPGKVSLYAMPLFLGKFVPIGLSGLLIAAMLAADMSTDSSYMLTWASVIYNDITAPFRKTQWSEKRGLLWNRMIVAAIGLFLLVFGLWYPLSDNLWDYLAVTGTIYLSSMAPLLIACCYWKRANSWGAVGSIILGAAIPLAYLILQLTKAPPIAMDENGLLANVASLLIDHTDANTLAEQIGPHRSGLAAFVASSLAMVIGSLVKPQGARTV